MLETYKPEEVKYWTDLADNLAKATIHPDIVAAGFHNFDGSRLEASAFNNSANTSVATSASAGTKGAWTQLIASTAYDADNLLVLLNWVTATRVCLVDIGIGGAGSEVVVAQDLPIEGFSSQIQQNGLFMLPVAVPGGSRIAARANISGTSTRNVGVTVWPISSGYLGILEAGQTQTYGVASTPALTTVTGGASNTKGSYAQLVASTTYDTKAVIVYMSRTATVAAAADFRCDIAVGAAGSEVIILPDLYTGQNNTTGSGMAPTTYGPIPMDIPSGTRIAARCQCGTASATLDVAVVAIS